MLPLLSSPQPAELGLYPKRLPWAPISVSGHVKLHLRLISSDLMPSTAHNTGLAHLNPKNQGNGNREACTTQTKGQDGEWPQTQPPKEAKSILLAWNYQESGSKSISCLSGFVVVVFLIWKYNSYILSLLIPQLWEPQWRHLIFWSIWGVGIRVRRTSQGVSVGDMRWEMIALIYADAWEQRKGKGNSFGGEKIGKIIEDFKFKFHTLETAFDTQE